MNSLMLILVRRLNSIQVLIGFKITLLERFNKFNYKPEKVPQETIGENEEEEDDDYPGENEEDEDYDADLTSEEIEVRD